MSNEFKKWFAARARNPDGITLEEAFAAGAQAQPAPSVPEGWLRAIDEALVVAHIGVANAGDTYEQAKAKLDNLIGLHVDVATDPAVNGGWKLVPIELTPSVPDGFVWPECPKRRQSHVLFDDGYEEGWAACVATIKAMIAAAPEAKS